MKVFVLMDYNYDGTDIEGVFATQEAAELAIEYIVASVPRPSERSAHLFRVSVDQLHVMNRKEIRSRMEIKEMEVRE